MVLESLLNPLSAEKRPWEMFFIGFVYSSVAILLSLWIFRDQTSLIMVFLTVMAAVPIVYATMKVEEEKDMVIKEERELLKEHNKAVIFLMFMFLGITLSFVAWYVFLPPESLNMVFDKQTMTIQAINNQVSGNAFQQLSTFSKILLNNIKVLAFAILFAFIYGAGAIFILTWNASVIGTAIGNFIRSNISEYASTVGFAKFSAYFGVASLGLLRYAIHGIPEIIAYFYGGLAGGILSVAIINKHYKNEKFQHIVFDVSELLVISIAFLLAAAFLEVYVTPLLF
ncbi:stage II sporulation protein M [Candidatus Woesearchaeota archaeon]|nr:stage II sporulation protein M [Candidatus Woesearchaeota archaeon]